MADDTTTSPKKLQKVRLNVTNYDMEDVTPHGCDHIIALMTQDRSLVLQMFSTVYPVINEKDGSPMTEFSRKCLGQFHITPVLAQRLITMIQDQLNTPEGASS